MTLIRKYRAEIVIAGIALLWHVLCFAAVVAAHNGDIVQAVRADDGYYELAQNVLAGNGYSMATTSPYTPNTLRTPGYIAFLVGAWTLTGSAVGAAVIQLLLACAIPILGMHIAHYLSHSTRVGTVSGLILALDPTLALLSFQLYTETVFLVLFLAWILITFRYLERPAWGTLIVGAVLLGSATLVKTSAQFIPFLFVACIMWRFGRSEWRSALMHAGIFLILVGAILAPWVVRNMHMFGSPKLSTQTAYVLYTNFAPAVRTVTYGTDFNQEIATFSTWEERVGAGITFQNADSYAQKALEVMAAHPLASLYVATKSLITFFTHDGVHALVARSGYPLEPFLPLVIVARLFWIAVTIAAGIGGIVYLVRERSLIAVFCITLVAYFALTSTIAAFGTNPRYRLPVDPILLALAALGVHYVREHIRSIHI